MAVSSSVFLTSQLPPQIPVHVGIDVDLSEYPAEYVHQRREESPHWSAEGRRQGIHPHDKHSQDWTPNPHQHKHHDPIAEGPQDGEGDADHDDKDVVHDKLGVLVYDVEDFVEDRDDLGAFVLGKAVFKLQLQKT